MRRATLWVLAAGLVAAGVLVAWAVAGPSSGASLDDQLAAMVSARGVQPIDMAIDEPEALVALGEALFWDKELSGNRDIACATCHHPKLGSGDALAVSIGTGGMGLGETRILGENRPLIPRNAPDLWNRGADGFVTMFWDGRVSGTAQLGFSSPAGAELPSGLPNALAVQAMFPVTSDAEMRGFPGDVDVFGNLNELALLAPDDFGAIWDGLMARLVAIPRYTDMFAEAFPGTAPDQLGFEHAAIAIAAFEAETFTSTQTPWDRYLRGETDAIDDPAKRGALLFYGEAGCAACHSGSLFTDQQFHNIGSPQVGPGKGEEAPDDFGRARETGTIGEMYAFRTPPLRNVVVNKPYFHDGAYASLEEAVRHHLDPAGALEAFAVTPLRDDLELEYDSPERSATVLALLDPRLGRPQTLTDEQVAELIAFLEALTDPGITELATQIPDSVPSGLPIDS